jgi:hypothetical protein
MKKIIIILMLAILGSALYAQFDFPGSDDFESISLKKTAEITAAEPEKIYKFTMQFSPPMMVISTFGLLFATEDGILDFPILVGFEMQYAVTKTFTLSLEPRYGMGHYQYWFYRYMFGYGCNGVVLANHDGRFLFFTLNPGFVFKPQGESLHGFYIGIYPTIGWRKTVFFSNLKNSSVTDNFIIWGITFGMGYQWVFKSGFSIALGGSIGRTYDIASNDNIGRYDNSLRAFVDFSPNFKLGFSY